MRIAKAVVTAAGPHQRTLPLQTLIDRDGQEKSVLRIIVEEVLSTGVEELCVVVRPGDEAPYAGVVGEHAGRLQFAHQDEPRGYADAVYCARDFVGREPFLHLVGDHLYVSSAERGCAQQVVDVAEREECAVSAVQSTRESQLPYYGTIGGRRLADRQGLYRIEQVAEKPTPTQAEQHLLIPGLRAGHYLCLFGIHVLTPAVFDVLHSQLQGQQGAASQRVCFSETLTALARQEQYLALEAHGWRYDVGVRYGLLQAQLALALNGVDREQVLSQLLQLMAVRQLHAPAAEPRS